MILLVMIRRLRDGSATPGLLLDMAPGGTRVLTKTAFDIDERIELIVISRDGQLRDPVGARLIWKKEGKFRYGFPLQFGVTFHSPVEEEMLQEMIRSSQLPS